MLKAICRITIATALTVFVGSVAAAEQPIRLHIDEAVEMALQHNLGMQVASLDRDVGHVRIAEAEAQFGRTLEAGAAHRTDRSPSVSSLEQVSTATTTAQTFGIGLNQPLKTGGRVRLLLDQTRTANNAAFRTIDPVFASRARIEITQPLLRGRGKVSRADIDRAENSYEQAEGEFDDHQRGMVADVRATYWDLFLARANLRVQRQLLEGGNRVLELVRTRVEMGADARYAILEVGVASREEDIVKAEDGVRDSEDGLRSLLALDRDPATWSQEIVPLGTPALPEFRGDLDEGIARALASSSILLVKDVAIRNLDVTVDEARDGSRPAVDLSLTAGLSGIGASYSDDWQGLGGGEGRNWRGGLAFTVPLGASREGARLSRALLEKEREALAKEKLRLEIIQQVREQHRQVRTNMRRAEVAILAEELAEQNVREQEERLSLGLSTVRRVLDTQDDLAEAQIRSLTAVVDYNKAMIEWERMVGR